VTSAVGRLFATLQYLLPHHLLCRLVYALTRSRRRWLKDWLIRAFVHHYRPRLNEALEPDASRYESFNAFFTRALLPAARPLDADAASILCPCDGALSLLGGIEEGQLLQAKGQRYSLAALLAGEREWCERLSGGSYATLYLAPQDYHRVHMPLPGRLCAAWHVPGRLFSVNAPSVARVPGLFARNERLVCLFEAAFGPFAVILVGALFVGSMSTVWHGEVTPWRSRAPAPLGAPRGATPVEATVTPPSGARGLLSAEGPVGAGRVHRLKANSAVSAWQPRGAELGRFNMGSTVILLLPPGAADWDPARPMGSAVRVGEPLGRLRGARTSGLGVLR
jgi:phosphatidylserine decarboxylase